MPRAHRSKPTYQALLLVDGYNVIGACPRLQGVRDRDGLANARHQLIEALTNYSAVQSYDTRIVFDAYAQADLGTTDTVTPHVAVCYTHAGQTADSFIEKTCADFRYDLRKFEQRLIVATSDQAQRLTAQGYGAEWISAQRLITEIDTATHHVKQRQRSRQRSRQRFLMSSLDPVAQAQLAKLRLGLNPTDP